MAWCSPFHHILKCHKEVKGQVLMKFIVYSFSFGGKNFIFEEIVTAHFRERERYIKEKCSPTLI